MVKSISRKRFLLSLAVTTTLTVAVLTNTPAIVTAKNDDTNTLQTTTAMPAVVQQNVRPAIKAAAHSELTPNHWHDAIALLSYHRLWSR